MRFPEAKFKLDSKDGTVELEGPPAFVDKHLEKIEQILNSVSFESDKHYFGITSLKDRSKRSIVQTGGSKHTLSRQSPSLHPIPVDLKENGEKLGLRQFYAQKKPSNHYERTAVFAYYLAYHNQQAEVRYGELLSCYEEVGEKKPSITDIVKNTIRYKGWLEPGPEKFTAHLTISGENFVKFDLPSQKPGVIIEQSSLTSSTTKTQP